LDILEVKTLLQIPAEDTSKDEYLTAALPLLVEYVKSYCNQTFLVLDEETGEESEVLPGGVKFAIAKMAEYNMVNVAEKSSTIGAYSVTYATGGEYPKSILKLLRPYRQVSFV
jgi:hypothetical protein